MRFLIGTTSYESLAQIDVNVPLPDYVVVDNFFSIAGDTLQLEWMTITVFDTLAFTAGDLPIDGTNSLNHAYGDSTNTFFSATNSPTNFSEDTGTVLIVPEPTPTPTPTPTTTPTPTAPPPPGLIDHYKVYSLQPQAVAISPVHMQDQFGAGFETLTDLVKLGVPVTKAIAPNSPAPLPGGLHRPNEHLTWYEFFDPQPIRHARLKNQFTHENKGAIWEVGDGHSLLVPADKDFVPGIELGQHWKCYDAVTFFDPAVTVNLRDQFGLQGNIVVGPGQYLCNPANKNFEGQPPLPNVHLACYDISGQPSLGELHFLDDQFGPHNGFVESPELLCLPSIKFLPEPGGTAMMTAGVVALAGLYRRRRHSAER